MNLPNKLTLTRIILVPVFMIFVSLTSLDSIVDGNFNATFYLLAGIVFAAASFTDYLDGHLARKWHMVTDFGKFADPLADKLLTTVAFIYMLRDGVCSPVVLCIILAREFAVSGLRMVSDWLKVRITSDPGDSFLDRMIALVEGASRKKTPNEIALNTLLVSLTVIFLIVIVTLYPIALYSGVQLQTSTLIALMVCLIPTTIGGLLSAIGIAGMDRVTRFNVIAMSGKAVEACGDVDTMILDKTGTITYVFTLE